MSDIGGDGIVAVATDGALIERNVVGHANQRSEDYNVAIWSGSADNTLIQYNEAFGTRGQRDGEGFDSDWNSKNTIIQFNYSHENDGGYVLICNEGGHSAEESAGNSGTIARYNISQNDRTRGIRLAGPVKNSLIYNNTIYVGPRHSVDLLLQADWHGWAEGTRLYNNIFYVKGNGRFSHGISRDADGAYATEPGFGQSKEIESDSNVYYGNVTATGDAHHLVSDPQIISPGSGALGRESLAGYRLRANSPARKNGKRLGAGGERDFGGNQVPSCGGIDRGALQFADCNEPAH